MIICIADIPRLRSVLLSMLLLYSFPLILIGIEAFSREFFTFPGSLMGGERTGGRTAEFSPLDLLSASNGPFDGKGLVMVSRQ